MAQNVVELTDQTFESEVIKADLPVVVDFWAPRCGPCRAMAPVLEQYAQEQAGVIKLAKINVDDHGSTAAQFGVMSIPTFLIFSGGKPVGQFVGAMPKEEFAKRVAAALGK